VPARAGQAHRHGAAAGSIQPTGSPLRLLSRQPLFGDDRLMRRIAED
jgi:hypothetical protein